MATDHPGPEYWGEEEIVLWDSITRGFSGLKDDVYAARVFSGGWLEHQPSKEMRSRVRDAFLDYAVENNYLGTRKQFDWEAWREYMGYFRD